MLTSPLTLRCGLVIPERIALAPLTNTQSHTDGTLDDVELRWLVRRATGGFRFVSTCAAFVSEEGHAWDGQLGIASDAHLPGLTRMAAALRDAGAVSVVQLHHGGVEAKLAPDPISTGGPDGARAATPEDLARVVRDFVDAAVRAERAGFDGVEVHGANGYLFTQFLAPADNPRTDAYGGSLENRARLLREAVRAVRSAVSPGFAVGVRLSVVDTWAQRGLVLADGVQVGGWLAEDGVDFVHLSLRDAAGPPPFEPDAGVVVRALRDALPAEVAVFAAGGVWTRADAERVHGAGADVVVLGKVAIGNPDWPGSSRDAGWEPVRPPYTPAYLAEQAVGERLVTYLSRFPGMVVGGMPARS
ncbi:MAG: NADH:flavin oxidoreductase [Myxococcota bacterium]